MIIFVLSFPERAPYCFDNENRTIGRYSTWSCMEKLLSFAGGNRVVQSAEDGQYAGYNSVLVLVHRRSAALPGL